MRQVLLLMMSIALLSSVMGQQQTFDLVTYQEPKGWTKEIKKNIVTYTKIDEARKTWCVIGVVKSTTSKGSIEADLESEWNDLVVKQYNADSMQATETMEGEGWKVKSASGKFVTNKTDNAVILTTFSGYNRCVSILATTNSQQFLESITDFVGNINLKVPDTTMISSTDAIASSTGFRFTTSNFDDGWTAVEEADWVRVTKGNITVLLHYAKAGTVIAADPEPHVNNAWNILVAPRYSNLKNYKVASPPLDHQRGYLGAGDLTDKQTGKQVYVALFRKGSSNWLEVITPDKASFVDAFGADVDLIKWDSPSEIWNPLLQLFNYNKFAVAASDLTGKWASWSGAGVQYVNVYTGLDAGMGHAQSSNEIVFNANGTYNREYKGVSGSPGTGNKYYGEKNNGNAIVSNWEVQLTNAFKGETHVFSAYFEAVKGGRILHLYRGNIEDMHMYKVK
ncbi:MAG: hypothetical protein WBP58_09605 [Chitinophagaceae bacterium]